MAPGGPIIDSNLLAQIQTLTNQLLSKTEAKSEPEGFNTVSRGRVDSRLRECDNYAFFARLAQNFKFPA